MVLRITIFDGNSQHTQLVCHKEGLASFLNSIKISRDVSFIVQNEREKRQPVKDRQVMDYEQLLKHFRYNIERDDPNKNLVSNVYVVRGFAVDEIVQLNLYTVTKVQKHQESRIEYGEPRPKQQSYYDLDLYSTNNPNQFDSPVMKKQSENENRFYKKGTNENGPLTFSDKKKEDGRAVTEESKVDPYQMKHNNTEFSVAPPSSIMNNNKNIDLRGKTKTRPKIVQELPYEKITWGVDRRLRR